MTRSEFDGGWAVLKGVWPNAEQKPEVYFALLAGLPASTWAEAVRRVVGASQWFPTPSMLLDAAFEVEQQHAADQSAVRSLPEPTNAKRGHDDCPMLPGETYSAYLQRLAIFLGYAKPEGRDVG